MAVAIKELCVWPHVLRLRMENTVTLPLSWAVPHLTEEVGRWGWNKGNMGTASNASTALGILHKDPQREMSLGSLSIRNLRLEKLSTQLAENLNSGSGSVHTNADTSESKLPQWTGYAELEPRA